MAMKINPPDFSKCKSYERYKQELKAWRIVTDLPKKKQGIAIALSLPEDGDETGIREKVFEELELEDLERDTGLDTLIAFFDKNLGKDDVADLFEKFEDFEDYGRGKETSIMEYIKNFDQKYNRLVKLNMSLPVSILAFKLLKRANITKEQRMLVLTGMDFNKKETLFDQAKASLKKLLGDSSTSTKSSQPAVKLEPSFLAENEEALLAAGYVRKHVGFTNIRGGGYNCKSRGYNDFSTRGRNMHGGFAGTSGQRLGKSLNPVGGNGKPMLCKSCGSFRHLLSECPHSYENMPQVHWTDAQETDFKDIYMVKMPLKVRCYSPVAKTECITWVLRHGTVLY